MTKATGGLRNRVFDTLLRVAEATLAIEVRRAELASSCSGRVLDVGVGTGHNLRYLRGAETVVGLDPDLGRLALATDRAAGHGLNFEGIEGLAENIPLPDDSFDFVIETLTMCEVSDMSRAASEMARLCKPGGVVLMLDHVRSHVGAVGAVEAGLSKLTSRFFREHLDRNPLSAALSAGLTLERRDYWRLGIMQLLVLRKPLSE
ncbi:MAG: hypothetical protein NVS3B24_18530 [Candidatus Dormibacteria bacterium]